MKSNLKILLVDDNPDDRILIQRELKKEFPALKVIHIIDENSFKEHLRKGDFNLVITDYRIRWTNGIEIVRQVKNKHPDCPVIMFTGTGTQEIAIEAMKAGLDDYVIKSPRHFKRLPVAVKCVLEKVQQRKDLREAELRYKSLFDNVLIGLYITNPEGRIINTNPTLAKMLGYSGPKAFLNADPGEFFVKAEDRVKWTRLLRKSGILENFETQLKTKDGRVIWVEDNARAVRDENGKLTYYEGSLKNITQRKKNERKIKNGLKNLEKALEGTIYALSRTIEIRDPYTAGHQKRVALLSRKIAREMGVSGEKIKTIYYAGMIHDIGKIAVPSEILVKPGKLTELEFKLVKAHPRIGYEILKNIKFPWPIAEIVLQHHERLNGSGYPQGLKGDDILLEARILSVADVVEAMSSHRPYRPALGIGKALEEISKNKGILYDSRVADACLKVFEEDKIKF